MRKEFRSPVALVLIVIAIACFYGTYISYIVGPVHTGGLWGSKVTTRYDLWFAMMFLSAVAGLIFLFLAYKTLQTIRIRR